MDDKGQHLDLTSDAPRTDRSSNPRPNHVGLTPANQSQNRLTNKTTSHSNNTRKFVGIQFNCCDIYIRVYINQTQTAYEGRCPRCLKPVCLKIGSGGTDSRFFTVS